MRLIDRVALVIGGSSGIGRGICLELERKEAKVAVVNVREKLNKGNITIRLGLPPDVGRAAVFFASDDAEWTTGTALPVDGGVACSDNVR